MRRVEIIVSFILIILITMSGGCINAPQGEKTESPVIETAHEGVDEHISENTSPREGAKATFPAGTFKPKRPDWFSYSPKDSVSEVVSRISEKYNVTESPVDIPLPPRSLSSFTGAADGIEFGLFAYPNSTAVEEAMNGVVGFLIENGFQQGDGTFWERGNETYTAFYTYERYFYVLFVARTAGGDSEERAMRLSEFTWSIITIGPSPGKVLGLFLPVKVAEGNWSEERGLRFSGYLDALEGTVEGTNVSAVFLVYRPREGREVYLQLKEAFLRNSWVEEEYINTNTRDPAGHLVVSDYFEANGSGVYIELADVAGMERLTLLFGDESEIKETVRELWEWDDPTASLLAEGNGLPRGTFRPASGRSVEPEMVISMVLDDLRKDFNITTDFVDIPEVPAAAWYSGRTDDVEFMLLVYPNATAYLTALDELTEKLLAEGWERTDDGREPYARTFAWDADMITVFAQYRYNHYLAIVVKKPRYSTSDFFWHVVGTGGASPGELLSFGKLRNDVRPWNWTAGEGLEFDGYIYKLEGNVSSGGARAAVLFYPYGLGREVYLQLKKAFLEMGWVERDYVELPSHDERRRLAANDLFEKSGKAVYIEVSTYGDMDVLILLYGDKSSVKISARAMWE
ncbi:hypothetical protein APY94_00615 [Thermococcus celericrescens]|uniref:Uncharacterized protein n=1 Tax=Thermococcus celericrescens TaxID=227598 RepID=A0A100XZQ8_9EURY|nr:hypothetical protein [Thermococcus celericrescens]KUH34718.1 hypothetical protein APY94_00615 [Thermococcus celericrescens]